MTQRYKMEKRPFGHAGDPNAREHWAVFDLAPEPEIYYTVTGHPMMESKAPSWRIVATCSKESHAEMVRDALNHDCDEEIRNAIDAIMDNDT